MTASGETGCSVCGATEDAARHIYPRWIGKTGRWRCTEDGCGACDLRADLRDVRAERDAALAVLRQLVAADHDIGSALNEYQASLAYDRLDEQLDAARRLLAGNGAGEPQ